jgi:hypothetical protein
VLPAVKDEAGCIFLDRDPRHFQLVLNYLRDGWCQLPKTLEERRELLQEVRYYQVRPCMKLRSSVTNTACNSCCRCSSCKKQHMQAGVPGTER